MSDLRTRLSVIASSTLPNAALVSNADRVSVGDIREIMRAFTNVDGWYRCACEKQTELMELRARLVEVERDNERLLARQQELLATIVRVTNETPYPEEIKGWQSQRSVMIAEVGSLKAEVIGLKRALLNIERDRDRCLAAVVETGTDRDRLRSLLAEACGIADEANQTATYRPEREKRIAEIRKEAGL